MNLSDDRVWDFLEACWNAGIKNPASFLISKRPQVYDWLKGIFPRGILPTDIDGEVEINGQFLRLEFKDESALRNGVIAKGQMKALKRLTSTKRFTVFIIGTNLQGSPTCMVTYHHNGKFTELQDMDQSGVQDRCRKWSLWAEGQRS